MFTGALPLGRLFGIRISFSLSWLIIFFLVWFNLAGLYLPAHFPRWPLAFHWAAGLFASVLFFLCVILHELAHCLVAVRYGLPVRGITLFALGGVSHIGRDVPSPRVEFGIALAGPATSLLLGGLAALLWLPLHQVSRPAGDLLLWLGSLNVVLAIFNLLPGFPLDGGRLLRSIVWFAADDFTWATKVASRSGQLAALTMALAGLFLLIEQRRGGLTSGLWLMVIGWFLFSAAGASYHSVMALHALRGLFVRDLMRRTPLTVPADASLDELAESFTARRGDDPAVVLRDDAPVGLIQPSALRRYPAEQLATVRAGEAMSTLRPGQLLAEDLPAGDALQTLLESGSESLPVGVEGQLSGLVRQEDLFRAMELRRRLDRGSFSR